MRITKRQLKTIIREETVGVDDPNKTADAFGGGDVADEMFVDVDDEVLLNVNEKRPGAAGQVADLEIIPERRNLSRAQLRRIVKEEKIRFMLEQDLPAPVDNNTHHWPRVDWTNVGELADKWAQGEEDAFDPGDPSMSGGDDESQAEAKQRWLDQVDNASMDFEAELTVRVRKLALQTMQEFTDKLINGDYS